MEYGKNIDGNLLNLLDVLNALPGIETVASCGGHRNPENWQLPAGKFFVEFGVKERKGVPTIGGYASLRRIVGMSRYMNGVTVTVEAMAIPVYDADVNADVVKTVGVYYMLHGEGADPDDVAEALSTGAIPKSLQRKDVRVTPKFWPME
jgi:hypothetical protein